MRIFQYKGIIIHVADTFLRRLFGLLPQKKAVTWRGLLIIPCRQVHTFGMRFPIDVLFLKNGAVLRILPSLNPGRISPFVREADSVLELAAGAAAEHQIQIGDEIHERSSGTSK
jgi:uncharacterized membrane protein (UPF0127 family)